MTGRSVSLSMLEQQRYEITVIIIVMMRECRVFIGARGIASFETCQKKRASALMDKIGRLPGALSIVSRSPRGDTSGQFGR